MSARRRGIRSQERLLELLEAGDGAAAEEYWRARMQVVGKVCSARRRRPWSTSCTMTEPPVTVGCKVVLPLCVQSSVGNGGALYCYKWGVFTLVGGDANSYWATFNGVAYESPTGSGTVINTTPGGLVSGVP